ncbi:guanine nucleotide-binding protein subunit gamma 3-like isoform X2 [Carex rostrata]
MGDNGLNTPPYPKSPPEYPDVCGKHRLKVAVQSLNQEIDFLKRELNSMEGTVPASRCCKELNEYVSRNPDPLIKVYEKRNNSCSIWNIFSWGWICCTRGRGCLVCPKQPKTCCCMPFKNIICCRWCRVGCTECNCCKMSSCNFDPLSSRPECSCGCVCSCSRFAETCVCPPCTGCYKIRCIC